MAKSWEFDRLAFEDLAWWVEDDRKQTLKIIRLIQKVQRYPFHGKKVRYSGLLIVPEY
ncbi:MAG: type II toxin-antitoxin system YoeB family toxin [Microcystis sp. M54BS1]|jgi:Txe/YoeB family toxin of Txe-Axe toxin-antitoxin module|uniref:type II toxin-antitoxin system YoeB family toxin n=1 Tax=unclassified Microcystis TaxID=2643300 RepID=UPI00187EE258|nr:MULTISPECIES: type II toxin-antitoxin system YoeB family toxin [unclassified Microcystis]MCA2537717.1 type II toxin-antitoxin system YoeB family toxin [Microcystis sp. M54BS1]MCA2594623.1 type II toxin-antitoxin system YoeB family toxin [Microcystis sp. M38BS1]MCA2612022.1 type II toxin-antitoxin system YoeB family toxin [Microcystis sp. M27BS1]MBE9074190.1 type II toxin-antitoxin system YoeB family toxin [Microcystis sp. LEGE 08355]MCA2504622.1 type II toxin-antitoxin system YoeB family to